jgi:hypothetical protein
VRIIALASLPHHARRALQWRCCSEGSHGNEAPRVACRSLGPSTVRGLSSAERIYFNLRESAERLNWSSQPQLITFVISWTLPSSELKIP